MCHPDSPSCVSFPEEVEVSFEAALSSFPCMEAVTSFPAHQAEPAFMIRRSSSTTIHCTAASSSEWDQDVCSGLDSLLQTDNGDAFEVFSNLDSGCSGSFDEWTIAQPEPVKAAEAAPVPSSVWEVDSLLLIDEPETPPTDSDSESALSRTGTPNRNSPSASPRPTGGESSAHAASHQPSVSASAAQNDEAKAEQPARTRGGKPRSRKNKKPFYWTAEDHKKFLAGLAKFGLHDSLGPGGAELVAMFMGNRTPLQVRSHAQKYFSELGLAR